MCFRCRLSAFLFYERCHIFRGLKVIGWEALPRWAEGFSLIILWQTNIYYNKYNITYLTRKQVSSVCLNKLKMNLKQLNAGKRTFCRKQTAADPMHAACYTMSMCSFMISAVYWSCDRWQKYQDELSAGLRSLLTAVQKWCNSASHCKWIVTQSLPQ